jgi:hypothetical protein
VTPGVVRSAIMWQQPRWFGVVYVGHVVESSGATWCPPMVSIRTLRIPLARLLRLRWRHLDGKGADKPEGLRTEADYVP